MQLGQGVEWAVHCCTLLALVPPDNALPAARLAEYHGVPPAYLAKHLQALAQVGIVESVAGRNGGEPPAPPARGTARIDLGAAGGGNDPPLPGTAHRPRGPRRGAPRGHPAPPRPPR